MELSCRFRWKDRPSQGRIVDLSKGGAFVESQDSPPPGSHLDLQVGLPDGQNAGASDVTLSGTVRHSGMLPLGHRTLHGFGIEFEETDGAVREAVARLLDHASSGAK